MKKNMTHRVIVVIMGTRPEAIKMAPIVHALRKRSDELETVVVATAQHCQMLDQVLSLFEIAPDVDLDLMQPNQTLTDSGGVQEEAPTLQKPLLVWRELTERPKAFQAGLSKVIGTDREAIVRGVSRLLSDDAVYSEMASGGNPYGEGGAAERIAELLCRWSRG